MLCQTVAGTAFARIHVGAVQRMGGSQQVRHQGQQEMQAFEILRSSMKLRTFRVDWVDFRCFGWLDGGLGVILYHFHLVVLLWGSVEPTPNGSWKLHYLFQTCPFLLSTATSLALTILGFLVFVLLSQAGTLLVKLPFCVY